MSFHVGQRVVCVGVGRGAAWERAFRVKNARVGAVYTVRASEIIEGRPRILLEEIINHRHSSGREYGFWASRFRPIVSRKTDISALKALLVPGAKIRETA